jgi:outer membrane PBP1 activator LpoA protein
MQERLMLRTRKAAVFAALSLLAAGCQTPQTASTGPSSERLMAQADRLSRDKQYAAAAQAYEELAAKQTGELRSRVLLRAARDWLRVPDVAKAQALLPQIIDQSLPAPDRVLRQLVGARIALLQRQPERALADLDRIPAPYPRDQAAEILELRTLALFDYGRPAGAVITAIDREQMLNDTVEVERNRRMIWDGIERSAASGINMQAPPGANRVVSGWLELGKPALALARNPFSAQPALTEWLEKYPDHPAHSLITRNVLPQLNAAMVYPDQVALLLPLTGRQQANGVAVRDGFLAAAMQQPSDKRPRVRIYDSAANIGAAYQQAIAEGAKFVVGPLLKEEITQLLGPNTVEPALTVPMLALNAITESRPNIPVALFQFALDPEDEAQQVAARIVADGKRYGMTLLPNNEWGRRVQAAFDTQLRELGGAVVATRFYDVAAKDYSVPVRNALLIDESRARANALSNALGTKLEFEPRSRGDIEFVFVGAEPAQGRLLRPALRFHLIDDLPVYATSNIFEPDSAANSDLDGVLFPDMPWVVAPDDVASQLRNTLTRYWPNRMRGRGRLFAFGFDAYRMIPTLQAHAVNLNATTTPGMTGLLSVDNSGRVRRQLNWARVVGGQAQPVLRSDAQVKN